MATAALITNSSSVTNAVDLTWNWAVLMRDYDAAEAESSRSSDLWDAQIAAGKSLDPAQRVASDEAFAVWLAAENALLAAPAPDLKAAAWKLRHGVLGWDFAPEAAAERTAIIRTVLADIERLVA